MKFTLKKKKNPPIYMFFASVTDVLGLSEPQDGSSSETHEMSERGLKQEMMSVSPPLHCVGGGGGW